MDALEEKKIMLKEALANQQIDQETYDKLITGLEQKEKDLKVKNTEYNFWHSKPMKIFWWFLLFVFVALMFVCCINIWVKSYPTSFI